MTPLVRDAVLQLVKGRTESICPTCISKGIGVPFPQALDAVMDIELRGDHAVREGVCGQCHQEQRHVLWPRRGVASGF